MEAADGANLWMVLPNLLWFLFSLIALWIFKDNLKSLLTNLIWRVKTGASLKVASIEIGESHISPNKELTTNDGPFIIRSDENNARYEERRKYYRPNRRVFLVHKIAPSSEPGQLYDILMYLVPHKEASLTGIKKVDYYFGESWGKIFTSIDRANGFPISTSAYGPFVCTAEIHFSDGDIQMVWRYIDFEMGSIGKEIPPERET
jgi:hypothetical protein